MLKNFMLAMRFLWREALSGGWTILSLALILAVASLTTLHFFTDKINRGLEQRSDILLGGNLAVESSTAIPKQWIDKAHDLSLHTAELWSFPTVANANDRLQFIYVQAISKEYPLVGDTKTNIEKGSVWVEPRLLSLLHLQLNDTIDIGAARFVVRKSGIDPFIALNFSGVIAPRVVISLEDVPATQTVLPGSRVDYRLLLAGPPQSLQAFKQWLLPQLTLSQKIIAPRDQQKVLQNIFSQIEHYLELALLVTLVMSAITILLSVQQYLRKHYASIALFRCLGMKASEIVTLFIWQLLMLAFVTGLMGSAIGYFAQEFISHLFDNYLQFPLPTETLTPVVYGLITSSFLLLAFSYPIIKILPQIPPIFIWRQTFSLKSSQSNTYFVIALLLFLVLIYLVFHPTLLTLFVLDLILISIGFLYACSIFLLKGISWLSNQTEGIVRRGLSNLVHYPQSVSLQITCFTLMFTLLVTLLLLRTDLFRQWQQSLPSNAPNYFAFNIAEEDLPQFKALFATEKIPLENIYPMVRGRLIKRNGIPIISAVPPAARGHNALHRELNLSFMWDFPSDNKIVSGNDWQRSDTGKPYASVADNLAKEIGLKIGDVLTFQLADRIISAKITNFRSLDWTSFHPNFYVIFPPGFLQGFPTTYITSFFLTPTQTNILNKMVEEFPNITVIDVANILKQINDMLAQITAAIQFLFLFALIACVLIFIASLSATMDERRETYSLLHVFGASRTFIVGSLITEFVFLGLIIVALTFLLAKIIVWALAKWFVGI